MIKIEEVKQKKPMGLAALSPERRKEIAAMGGKAQKPSSRNFFKNRKAASDAGKKGGTHPHKEKRTFAVNRDLASRASKMRKRKKDNGDLHNTVENS